MRLWHFKLIPYLPNNQLLGQHRECCALRGNSWNKNHFVINYIFKYNFLFLFNYHNLIILEMLKRGYKIDKKWYYLKYRGKKLGNVSLTKLPNSNLSRSFNFKKNKINHYKEHNNKYLTECLNNLKYAISNSTKKEKGIDLFNYFSTIKDLGKYDKK